MTKEKLQIIGLQIYIPIINLQQAKKTLYKIQEKIPRVSNLILITKIYLFSFINQTKCDADVISH